MPDRVLLRDQVFVHRLSDTEGKDGNPLKEVRGLCNSLPFDDGQRDRHWMTGGAHR
jgi:hypothetical protein